MQTLDKEFLKSVIKILQPDKIKQLEALQSFSTTSDDQKEDEASMDFENELNADEKPPSKKIEQMLFTLSLIQFVLVFASPKIVQTVFEHLGTKFHLTREMCYLSIKIEEPEAIGYKEESDDGDSSGSFEGSESGEDGAKDVIAFEDTIPDQW